MKLSQILKYAGIVIGAYRDQQITAIWRKVDSLSSNGNGHNN